ncbi:hypothetical protein Cni_G22582 [Canna indica]|uniref:Uncharacterized protein n=1 Tax=Canna indica TaxID=4628 RepID=A0AAQ3KY71_9LILI|nr:hypothetical protein Cni_G22582 [Canna indica]
MEKARNLFSWICGRKPRGSRNPGPISSSDFAMRGFDSMRFAAVGGPGVRPNSRPAKKKRHRPEERRIDKEHDAVLVMSDGGCMSGSESDSDWSVGWSEPHAPEFQSETETEDSFAVLVPCYRHGQTEQVDSSKNHVLGATDSRNDDGLDRDMDIEQWLAEHC